MAVKFGQTDRARNMKRTSQASKKRRVKFASMNKSKRLSWKPGVGQGR
jgi:hypothetical protein